MRLLKTAELNQKILAPWQSRGHGNETQGGHPATARSLETDRRFLALVHKEKGKARRAENSKSCDFSDFFPPLLLLISHFLYDFFV